MTNADEQQNQQLDDALTALYQSDVPQSFQQNWLNAVKREENEKMNNAKAPKPKNLFMRVILPAAAVLILVLGANWVGEQNDGFTVLTSPTHTTASRSSKSTAGSAGMVGDSANFYASEAAYDMAADSAPSAVSGAAAAPEAVDSRKLIRTASLTLRTASYSDDLSSLQALIAKLGGSVESSYESGDAQNGDTRSLDMEVRIPADKLEAFLSGVDGIGRVVSRSESSRDMTVQYADNEARLATLRDKLTRLNELLKQADNVTDMIEIETAIADTQYQIDSYETTQRTIDRQVDMSQVSITLNEDSAVAVTSEMSMGERISKAFQASIHGLSAFLRNMLVFIVMALPVIVPVAALVIVWLIVRRNRAKKHAQKSDETRE